MINFAKGLKTEKNDFCIGSIITRKDNYNEKGKEVNTFLKLKCQELSFTYIDNSNIKPEHLNKSGIHLSQTGSKLLARNYLQAINI